MNLLAPVSEIMTKDLVTVSQHDPLVKLEEIFNEFRIHHIPVVDKGDLIGMVSKSDFLFFKRGFNRSSSEERFDRIRLNSYNVEDIMITRLAKLDAEDKVNVALEVFKKNLFHAIPVVDNGKLVGIVTTLDIIKHLAEDREAVNRYLS